MWRATFILTKEKLENNKGRFFFFFPFFFFFGKQRAKAKVTEREQKTEEEGKSSRGRDSVQTVSFSGTDTEGKKGSTNETKVHTRQNAKKPY